VAGFLLKTVIFHVESEVVTVITMKRATISWVVMSCISVKVLRDVGGLLPNYTVLKPR
jgi:hypothetical protein